MEKNYITELGKKYVSFSYEEEDYSLRMLTENKIPGCLTAQIRHLNGSNCLYYDVTGLMSLDDLYGVKEMSGEMCKTLLEKIVETKKELLEYFLDGASLCMDPTFIFYDVKEKRFWFMALPAQYWERGEEDKTLINFVVDHLEHKDVALTEKIYTIYRDIYRGAPLDVSGLQELSIAKEAKVEHKEPAVTQIEPLPVEEEYPIEPDDERGCQQEHRQQRSRKGVEYMLLLTVLVVVGALCYYMGLSLISFIGFACMEAGGYGIYKYFQGKHPEAVDYKIETESLPPAPVLADAPPVYQEHLDLDATVYEEIEVQEEYALYPVGHKGEPIQITHFPFTLGKTKEFCDYVLTDKGVSRVHARLTRGQHGVGVYLEDLDSTNGVYHNGFRILVGEEVLLEPEDEIQIGKFRFIYR